MMQSTVRKSLTNVLSTKHLQSNPKKHLYHPMLWVDKNANILETH